MHWLHRYRVSLLLIITQLPRWVEHRYRVNSNTDLTQIPRWSLTTQIPCLSPIVTNQNQSCYWVYKIRHNTATVFQLDQLFLLNTNPRKRLLNKVSLYLYISLHLQDKYSISTLLILVLLFGGLGLWPIHVATGAAGIRCSSPWKLDVYGTTWPSPEDFQKSVQPVSLHLERIQPYPCQQRLFRKPFSITRPSHSTGCQK